MPRKSRNYETNDPALPRQRNSTPDFDVIDPPDDSGFDTDADSHRYSDDSHFSSATTRERAPRKKKDNGLEKTIQKFVQLKDVSHSLSDELNEMNDFIHEMPDTFADTMRQFFRTALRRNTRRQKLTVLLSIIAITLAGVSVVVSQVRRDLEFLKQYNANLDRSSVRTEEAKAKQKISIPMPAKPTDLLSSVSRFIEKTNPTKDGRNERLTKGHFQRTPRVIHKRKAPPTIIQMPKAKAKAVIQYRPTTIYRPRNSRLRLWKPFLKSKDESIALRSTGRFRHWQAPSSPRSNSLPELPHAPFIDFGEPEVRHW